MSKKFYFIVRILICFALLSVPVFTQNNKVSPTEARQDWLPWDSRMWTSPDITAELASDDYRSNTDPAMKAIFEYVPRRSLTETLKEALADDGIDSAVKRFREFKAAPVNKYAATEEPLLIVGSRLLAEKKPDQALVLFKLNAEENPRSPRAYFALGEAYFQMGDKKQAIDNFEKALKINPKFYEVIERLKLAGKI